MKVLFDARYIDWTGIGTYVKTILDQAKKKKYVDLIGFLFSKKNRDQRYIATLSNLGYKTYLINSLPFQIAEHYELYKILKLNKISFFHSPHFNVPYFSPEFTKITSTIHDLAYDIFPDELKAQ